MRKIVYFLMLFLLIPLMSNAQRWKHERLSAYAGVGTNFFLGDLGGGAKDAAHYFSFRDIDWVYTRPVIQGGIRYRIIRDLAIKIRKCWKKKQKSSFQNKFMGDRNSI